MSFKSWFTIIGLLPNYQLFSEEKTNSPAATIRETKPWSFTVNWYWYDGSLYFFYWMLDIKFQLSKKSHLWILRNHFPMKSIVINVKLWYEIDLEILWVWNCHWYEKYCKIRYHNAATDNSNDSSQITIITNFEYLCMKHRTFNFRKFYEFLLEM